ncbi:uncharacterized protein LOC113466171 [Diaphorina citri]|uniref:Uncharacterized protein LOC113466171 n=1 Tax=Diaphorina citri TaxID=121845 RepID=A0A3Q0ILL3_DIACI|nr:uncharacterized protein LOC113466171 [Diaphorina citri]
MVHVRPIEKLRSITGYKRSLYGYEDIEISFHVILKAALLSKLPKDHDTVTTYFYKHSFNSFVNQNANTSLNLSQGSTSSTTCKGCTLEVDCCKCESIVDLFYKVNKVLLSLGILEQLTGNVITNLIHKHIEKHVEEMCTGSFDRSYIETLEQVRNAFPMAICHTSTSGQETVTVMATEDIDDVLWEKICFAFPIIVGKSLDIYDSKRINAHLHTDTSFEFNNQQFPVTAMILSAQFWPTFKDETLELPNVIKEHFAVYTKAFEAFKGKSSTN